MANQVLFTPNRALDSNAYALPGATATVYQTGTATLITLYSDESGSVTTSNPITADANGVFPQVFASVTPKVVVKDSDGATVWTIDPAPTTSSSATGASSISFYPTVDIPETNVQDAIEAAGALAISGVTAYGIGITGNAPTIADLDATGTASGIYRFTAATTGTFPTGVLAATTGLVVFDRQTAAEAIQTLRAAGLARVYVRHMAASTWGAWQEVPTTAAAAGQGSIPMKGASTWAALAIGTARQVPAVNTGATALEYVTTGTPVLLATKTASASATLDFTEFANTVYSRYLFVLENVKPATDQVYGQMRFSTNAGVAYDAGASDYEWSVNGWSATDGNIQQGNVGATSLGLTKVAAVADTSIGNAAAEFGITGEIKLFNAANASARTKIISALTYDNANGNGVSVMGQGKRKATQDTDAVRFLFSSGNIASGTIKMYGIV